MSALSSYYENLILNHILGAATLPAQANWYIGLFAAMPPSDAGGGTECSGTSYARKTVANNVTNFPTTAIGQKTLGVQQEFATAGSGGWGTAYGIGIWDDATGGNLCFYGSLTTPQVINEGDVARIPIGSIGVLITLE